MKLYSEEAWALGLIIACIVMIVLCPDLFTHLVYLLYGGAR